jgi:hypothetical protein
MLLLFGLVLAVQAQDDPLDLLRRVSHNVMETIDRMPKYVCTQTIDRSEYRLNGVIKADSCDGLAAEKNSGHLKRHLTASDRLRFDVAIGVSHEVFGVSNEMYSWVGDQQFHDRGLLDLVRQGAISTGTFSSFLISLFGQDRASFSYNGDRTVDGRLLSEYGFRVPLEKSNYVFRFGNERTEVLTAYDGTFLADPKTLDLVHLTVRQSLPAQTGACEATHTMDYGRVTIGGADFLMATDADLDILSLNGEMENRIANSACHEFVGQSTLSFGPSPAAGASRSKDDSASRVFTLPPDLKFELAFTEPIDTAVAAGGDPINAKLITPIRDQSSIVLVPAGSVVKGHIIEIKRLYAVKSLTIDVKLETVDVKGISRPLKARADSEVRRVAIETGSRLSQRAELGTLGSSQDREVAVFRFRDVDPKYVVKSGVRSKWVTLAP